MKSYVLKLTSAIVIDGQIHKARSLVEVSEAEAKNFLHRGKAVLATEEDGVELQEEQTGTDYSSWTKPALLEYAKTQQMTLEPGDIIATGTRSCGVRHTYRNPSRSCPALRGTRGALRSWLRSVRDRLGGRKHVCIWMAMGWMLRMRRLDVK